MTEHKLDDVDIEILKETEEGRKYLEYYERFKGEPIGFGPGMPDISKYDDDVIKLYDSCIKQGKTWQELLNWKYSKEAFY